MSVIIHLMGRVTRDPVMQQGKNSGTEYISLDLATSQRSQNAQNNPDNPYESVFYQCFFNKHLAERIIKAGVQKGTCLYIYGELEIHPFVYRQGQKAGQAGAGAKINVRDWQFCLSNKPENESGTNQAGGQAPYNGGAATPGAGGYQNPGTPGGGYQNSAGATQGGNYQTGGNTGNANYQNPGNAGNGNYQNGNPAGNANYQNGNANGGNYQNGNANGGASRPANSGTANSGNYQNGSVGSQMYQQTGNAQFGQQSQGTFAGDGFSNIPEGMPPQLPFIA